MNILDLSTFEKLHGKRPFQLLDRHPDGQHVALQVIASLETAVERAAVWDRFTGKRVWTPEGMSALAWLPGGEQVVLVYEQYEPSPNHPAVIGSPLQSEYAYACVRASWPNPHFIDACTLSFPLGWPCDVVVSPRADLAVVQWRDQIESGLEFVTLASGGPEQVDRTGLPQIAQLRNAGGADCGGFPLNTPLVTRPAFSPDGRYIARAWQDDGVWWSSEPYTTDANHRTVAPASPGGDYTVGVLSILDWQERTHRAIPLIEHIPSRMVPQAAVRWRRRAAAGGT